MSPVSPFLTLPGVCANRSQIDSPLPSSFHAPSIWYDAVAVPQKNPLGNDACAGGENCARGGDVVVPAFDATLQAENSDGIPVAAPAPRAVERKFRRVRRKAGLGLLQGLGLAKCSEPVSCA